MIAKAHLFEIKTDGIHWGLGLRVVVVLIVPLIVLGALGLTQYWANVSFGVIFVAISDVFTLKAPIGYRMRRLGIITLSGALLTTLGLVLGGELGDSKTHCGRNHRDHSLHCARMASC